MSIEPANQTPVPDPTKKEWTFLGINRADCVKMIMIPVFIGIVLFLFGAWFNWKSPHLKVKSDGVRLCSWFLRTVFEIKNKV